MSVAIFKSKKDLESAALDKAIDDFIAEHKSNPAEEFWIISRRDSIYSVAAYCSSAFLAYAACRAQSNFYDRNVKDKEITE